MKTLQVLAACATFALPMALPSAPGWAAACSRGADCRACSNCSGCGWCARSGGTCSVCRPDLHRAASASGAPVYAPPSTYSPPVPRTTRQRTAPRTAAPRRQRQSRRSITVPASWSGRVVGVSDGDTLTVMFGSSPVRVRLYGVDAPEKAQPWGQQAKNALSALAFGKSATVYSRGVDRYGRVLGDVHVGRYVVNSEQVLTGMAWWYRQYAASERGLKALEQQARSGKRGVWSQASPVAPWEWRRGKP